jgi:hypothetical protein
MGKGCILILLMQLLANAGLRIVVLVLQKFQRGEMLLGEWDAGSALRVQTLRPKRADPGSWAA